MVTVPLHYTRDQRNVIRDCATKAGFRVSQVISEPGAACLAYGLGQDDVRERYHVLVLKSSGVSSTLTVVLVSGGSYTVLASQDVEMGDGR